MIVLNCQNRPFWDVGSMETILESTPFFSLSLTVSSIDGYDPPWRSATI